MSAASPGHQRAGTASSSRSSRKPRSRNGGNSVVACRSRSARVGRRSPSGRSPVSQLTSGTRSRTGAASAGGRIAQQHHRRGEGERCPRSGRVAAADEGRTSAGVEPLPHRRPLGAHPAVLSANHRAAGRQREQRRGQPVDLGHPLGPAALRAGLDVDLQRGARAHHRRGIGGVAGGGEVARPSPRNDHRDGSAPGRVPDRCPSRPARDRRRPARAAARHRPRRAPSMAAQTLRREASRAPPARRAPS